MSETTAKKTYSADDSAVLAALQRMERGYARMQDAVEKLAKSSKASSRAEVQNWKEVEQALDAAIRKTERLKAAESASRPGGRLGALGYRAEFVNTGVPWPWSNASSATHVPAGTGMFGVRTLTPRDVDPRFLWGNQGFGSEPAAGRSRSGAGWDRARNAIDNVLLDSTLMSAAGQLKSSLLAAAGPMVALGAGVISVTAAVNALNGAMLEQRELQRSALDAHMSLAEAEAELILNTPDMTQAERESIFIEPSRRAAEETGIRQARILKEMSRKAGKGTGISREISAQSVVSAAYLSRHNEELLAPMGLGIQTIIKATGMDAKRAESLFATAMAAAHPDEPELQARFLAQSVLSALPSYEKPTEKTVEQLLELASSVSQSGGEERGEAVRTTMLAFSQQLKDFRLGRGAYEISGPMGMKTNPKPKGLPHDPLDVIEWFRQNPKEAERFRKGSSYERQYTGIWEGMLDANSAVSQQQRATSDAVTADPAVGERLRRDLRTGSARLKLRSETMEQRAREESQKAVMTPEAIVGSLRETRDRMRALSSSYANVIERAVQSAGSDAANTVGEFAGNPEDPIVSDMLIYRHRLMRRGVDERGRFDAMRLTEGDRKMFETLDALYRAALAQLAELKVLNGKNQSAPGAGPAMNAQRGVQSER